MEEDVISLVEKLSAAINLSKKIDNTMTEIKKLLNTEFSLQTNDVKIENEITVKIDDFITINITSVSNGILLEITEHRRGWSGPDQYRYNLRRVKLENVLKFIEMQKTERFFDKLIDALEEKYEEKQDLLRELKEIATMLEMLTR